MESHRDNKVEDRVPQKSRWKAMGIAGAVVIIICGAVWFAVDREETTRLARDTRIVMRIPDSFIDRLTPDEIQEQFPIDVTSDDLKITGTADVFGRVSIEIQPHDDLDRPDDVIVVVGVSGETVNELIGARSQVKVLADGRGTFEATKRIHFDGRAFTIDEEAHVNASHETEITDVQSLAASPLQGAVRLLASRNARSMLPELNALAEIEIELMVRERVDGLIAETVNELNQINRFDDTIARLHPSFERWRIAVSAEEGYLQGTLVPHGGRIPVLPVDQPTTLELWLRLTRTQRASLNLSTLWNQSHTMFRDVVSEEQARRIASEMVVSDHGEWTRFRIGARIENIGTQ